MYRPTRSSFSPTRSFLNWNDSSVVSLSFGHSPNVLRQADFQQFHLRIVWISMNEYDSLRLTENMTGSMSFGESIHLYVAESSLSKSVDTKHDGCFRTYARRLTGIHYFKIWLSLSLTLTAPVCVLNDVPINQARTIKMVSNLPERLFPLFVLIKQSVYVRSSENSFADRLRWTVALSVSNTAPTHLWARHQNQTTFTPRSPGGLVDVVCPQVCYRSSSMPVHCLTDVRGVCQPVQSFWTLWASTLCDSLHRSQMVWRILNSRLDSLNT